MWNGEWNKLDPQHSAPRPRGRSWKLQPLVLEHSNDYSCHSEPWSLSSFSSPILMWRSDPMESQPDPLQQLIREGEDDNLLKTTSSYPSFFSFPPTKQKFQRVHRWSSLNPGRWWAMTSWNIINSSASSFPPSSVGKAGQVSSYWEVCLQEKRENYFLKHSMSQKKRDCWREEREVEGGRETEREGGRDYFT